MFDFVLRKHATKNTSSFVFATSFRHRILSVYIWNSIRMRFRIIYVWCGPNIFMTDDGKKIKIIRKKGECTFPIWYDALNKFQLSDQHVIFPVCSSFKGGISKTFFFLSLSLTIKLNLLNAVEFYCSMMDCRISNLHRTQMEKEPELNKRKKGGYSLIMTDISRIKRVRRQFVIPQNSKNVSESLG